MHQGNWHGDVAIKILNMENTDDADATLEAFRLDVSTFRKTRHENLILFMGACMNPPKLAIVTSLCKGLPKLPNRPMFIFFLILFCIKIQATPFTPCFTFGRTSSPSTS